MAKWNGSRFDLPYLEARARLEAIDHGQAERERLAGAGWRLHEQVAAGQRIGDHAPLHGERPRDAAARERGGDGTGHAEAGEGTI
jgi:hypothetical protein